MARTRAKASSSSSSASGERPSIEERPYQYTAEEVCAYFDVDLSQGLTQARVEQQRALYGPNEFEAKEKKSMWALILEQFDDQLVKILLGAALVSFVLAFFEDGDDRLAAFFEPLVIALILIANAIIGVLQESKAENAIDALKEYEPERAVVIRDGVKQVIKASELVPGDVVVVSAGARLPADVRFAKLHSVTLGIDQAILTGESDTIQKHTDVVSVENAVNQDKTNIGFAGSFVTRGKATGVVVGTALRTEIGKIKVKLDETEEAVTPLKLKLDEFADQLSKYITVICILVWLINIHHFSDPDHGGLLRGAIYYFKIAVALAVAAIPEGLPTVVTTCLALGTMKMAKRNALVRSLPAVETLGCTTVICSDKTGTITTNKMSVSRFVYVESVPAKSGAPELVSCTVEGLDFSPAGRVLDSQGNELQNLVATCPAVADLALICSMCNGSSVNYDSTKRAYMPVGEPTEVALKVLVEKLGAFGSLYDELDQLAPEQRAQACNLQWDQTFDLTETLEFSRDRKSMSVVVNRIVDDQAPETSGRYLLCKGAPEGVLNRCISMRLNSGGVAPFSAAARTAIDAQMQSMAAQGLRVLALAMVENPVQQMNLTNSAHFIDYEKDMTFVGLVAMMDPPREEVRRAIEVCADAGIRVIMITGDNQTTAEAICRHVGIFGADEDLTGLSYTGREFDALSDEEQLEAVRRARVFSRTEPSHKSRLVELLQSQDDPEVVAMTGDGVNDAPALKCADIGVAMGSGTDVAKQASNMVLADDNFATIVVAVQEGRSIYANTKQFIRYLISSNIGEVACIFFTAALQLPEALIPVQLLWLNLVTDGLPASALSLNKADPDIMQQKPRRRDDRIINGWMFMRYLVIGLYVGVATVGGFVHWYCFYEDGPQLTWSELTSHYACATQPGLDCANYGSAVPSTISLSILVGIEMLNAFNSLSENQSLLQVPFWSNLWLVGAVALSLLLHLMILHVEFFQTIFSTAALGWGEWQLVIYWSLPVILLDEVMKFITRCLSSSNH